LGSAFYVALHAIGFLLLCLNFIALYIYVIKKRESLALDYMEYFDSKTEIYMWMISAGVGLVSLIFSLWLPPNLIGFAGYVLFALFPLLNGLAFYRGRLRKQIIEDIE
jgi:multisubunit Na+/H+ antiporter MnhB subunit